MNFPKKILTSTGAICFVLMGIAAMHPPDNRPKNLKILPKNISSDSLLNIMLIYERALGVECEYCHITKDKKGKEAYERDDIPQKDTCRKMMRMTNAINKTYFHLSEKVQAQGIQSVTCFTCHKGRTKPVIDSL